MSDDFLEVKERGYELLRDPLLNKGTAFTAEERRELGLEGLLPTTLSNMKVQAARVWKQLEGAASDMHRYLILAELQDRNEQLFHRVLSKHLEALMPIVYTPTVGDATRNYSHVFRRGRGVWITPEHRGRIDQLLGNAARSRRIRLIVVTDNEAILGIGDQGAGGMAISVGKLALYVAGAGIHPASTLPVSLDVGTDNQALLDDPLYVGRRQPRLRHAAYEELIEEFVVAAQRTFPDALIQWEDFRKDNALNIMERYRHRTLSFNDDIQGTGAVALAGLLCAGRITGRRLEDERIVILGAGAAGLGIARQLHAAFCAAGSSASDARSSIAVLDRRGLIVEDREFRDQYKRELAWRQDVATDRGLGDARARDLLHVVEAFEPTVLIGASGQAGAFTEEIVRAVAQRVERPVFLPFSNPTRISEATPQDIIDWTGGKALVATGSPFDPVQFEGRTIHVGQGNNVFIFPGLGLGALIGDATEVSDAMINAAAHALSRAVTEQELSKESLYPAVHRLREVTIEVATAVVLQAALDRGEQEPDSSDVKHRVRDAMWEPVYPTYRATTQKV